MDKNAQKLFPFFCLFLHLLDFIENYSLLVALVYN